MWILRLANQSLKSGLIVSFIVRDLAKKCITCLGFTAFLNAVNPKQS